ncbi:MAG: DNA-3-methyladenine glycosylase [Saprospiraceae bacterium]|nr:DNA-3-methyladenine glycosylase [Saprospiraceae bacterium]
MKISQNLLPESFYLSDDVVDIAQKLLGKYLITNINGIISSAMIVETEAYKAPDDKACHAYNNRFTPRTKTMFERGGVAYVYTCYGMHPLFNVVTGEAGMAHAVLIRAVQPDQPLLHYQERRKLNKFSFQLFNGPGKLAVAMGINKTMDGTNLLSEKSNIYIEDRNIEIPNEQIEQTPRVGMSVHTGPCAHKKWRFYINTNKWVSKPLFPDYTHLVWK